MPLNPTYSVGTVSVSAGGNIVTGMDTQFVAGGIQQGDIFECAGLTVTIGGVDSATQLTLVKPWPGAAVSSGVYEIRFTPDASRVMGSSRKAIADFLEVAPRIEEVEQVAAAANAKATPFASIAAASQASIPSFLAVINLSGYYAAGDGGGGIYRRVLLQPDHAAKFQSADGAWWELIVNANFLDARCLGAMLLRQDNHIPINNALRVLGGQGTVFIDKLYDTSGPIVVLSNDNFTLASNKRGGIRRASGSAPFALVAHDLETVGASMSYRDIILDGNYQNNVKGTSAVPCSIIGTRSSSTGETPDCDRFEMTGCIVRNIAAHGMGVHPSGYKYHVIRGNEFYDADEAGGETLYHFIYIRRFLTAHIDGNVFKNNRQGNAIKTQAAGSGGRSYIRDNDVQDMTGRGIYCADGCEPVVTGNRIKRVSGEAGIILTQDASTPPFRHAMVSGNNIDGVLNPTGAGIFIQGYDEAHVKDNTIKNFGLYGIRTRSAARQDLDGNIFYVTAANSVLAGLGIICIDHAGRNPFEVVVGRNTVRIEAAIATYLVCTASAGRVSYERPVTSVGSGGSLSLYDLAAGVTYEPLGLLSSAGWGPVSGDVSRGNFNPTTISLQDLAMRVGAIITDLRR